MVAGRPQSREEGTRTRVERDLRDEGQALTWYHFTQYAVADLGHFQLGIDVDRNTLEFAGFFQLRHEVA